MCQNHNELIFYRGSDGLYFWVGCPSCGNDINPQPISDPTMLASLFQCAFVNEKEKTGWITELSRIIKR